MGTAVWALTKMVPYSSSAADAMILRMIFHTTSKMPLVVGTKYSEFLGSGGPLLRKLDIHSDASHLSVAQARSRASGVHFLTEVPPEPVNPEYFVPLPSDSEIGIRG